jgi:hypothetical protein
MQDAAGCELPRTPLLGAWVNKALWQSARVLRMSHACGAIRNYPANSGRRIRLQHFFRCGLHIAPVRDALDWGKVSNVNISHCWWTPTRTFCPGWETLPPRPSKKR